MHNDQEGLVVEGLGKENYAKADIFQNSPGLTSALEPENNEISYVWRAINSRLHEPLTAPSIFVGCK